MDIHKPKPWHGVREFLKEYLIIVIGVLTALGAEQAVEALHWRQQVAAGEEELKTPFARDLSNTAVRAALDACVTRRLGELSAVLHQAEATGRLSAVGSVGQPPSIPWTVQTWEALVAAQTVAHMPQAKMAAYSAIRQTTAYLSGLADQEAEDWTILGTLQGPGRRMSDAEAEQMRLAIARASNANRQTLRVGGRLREMMKRAGIVDPAALAAAQKQAAADATQAVICHPLTTAR